MPLIKCVDCGKMISDRIESCPQCGCPVSVSLEENNKLMEKAKEEAKIKAEEEKRKLEEYLNTPAQKFEIDTEAELEALYDAFAPAILDENKIEEVGSKVLALFEKYRAIGDGVVYTSCYDLEKGFTDHKEALDYVKEQKAKQLKLALNQYQSDMNKPIEGLGFGVISTSAADTLLYGAMSAHNAAKQYMKNTKAANENLHASLLALGANSDTLMSVTKVIDFKYKIRKAVEDVKEFAERKYFLDSHKDFSYNPEKYDNGKEIGGVRLYNILHRGENTRLLYCGIPKGSDITRDILDKAENEGYINQYVGSYYGTTLKYEKEVLEAIFKEENPEEYARLQSEKQSQAEVVYNKAMEDLNNGLYYEAATALGSIGGYKDAMEISVKLWHEHILRQDRVIESLGSFYVLRDNGTVISGGYSNEEYKRYSEIISSWSGVDSILDMGKFSAFTFDGRVLTLNNPVYGDYNDNYKAMQTSRLKNLKSINGRFLWVALKENGETIAFGKNENDICEKATGIKNIEKVSAGTTANIAMLNKDGDVICIGNRYSGYEGWYDVVDVADDYSGLWGFKEDGTVHFISTPAPSKYSTYGGTHPSEWTDVYKYFGDGIAINKYGRVYAYGTGKDMAKLDGLEGIVYVVADTSFKVCIKADGTLLVIDSKIDISKWEDIVSVWGNYRYALGLKKDGTFVYGGDIANAEEIASWRMFENVNVNMHKATKEKFMEQKRIEKEQAVIKAKKELEECKTELANLKGLFAGMRRKQLEARIAEIEEELGE